jgi:hypothetical protein
LEETVVFTQVRYRLTLGSVKHHTQEGCATQKWNANRFIRKTAVILTYESVRPGPRCGAA